MTTHLAAEPHGTLAPPHTLHASTWDVERLAGDAESLDERLLDGHTERGVAPTAEGATLLQRWAAIVTRGDDAGFARRLAWDTLSTSTAAHALTTARGTDLAWARELRTVLSCVDPGHAGSAASALTTTLVEMAGTRVRQRAGAAFDGLTPAAHVVLVTSLRDRLAKVIATTEHDRECTTPRLLCARYPVLARLLVIVSTLWIDATLEFLRRLHADQAALADLFGNGMSLGPVTGLRAGLSDPHSGGRTVLISTWACGLSIVYKPRPLGVDARFAELLRWAAPRLGALAVRSLRVLTRSGYGWIEYAVPAPCVSKEAVARYYARCGVLVALVYAMNGTDFHHENLLAAGEQPVLLDLEMLLGPRFTLVAELPAAGFPDATAKRSLVESVLNLMLLPAIRIGQFPYATSSGALADPRAHNAAVLDGHAVPAATYVDEIVSGFDAMYAVLRAGAAELLTSGGILDRLRGETVRLVVRNTSLYYTLIERALRPEPLRSGVEFGMQLDVLSRTFLSMKERPPIWPLVRAERAALARLDVPLFAARADSYDLPLPTGELVRNCFAESAFDVMRQRLAGLNDVDAARQTALIRAAFAAASRSGLRVVSPAIMTIGKVAGTTAAEYSLAGARSAAIDAGVLVARALHAAAVRGDDGALAWVGLQYLPASRRHALQALSYGLFDGYGGLALFFAALARVTGDASHRASALAALIPVRTRLAEVERLMSMRRAAELGAGFGITSAALATLHVGRLIGDAALLDDARRLAAIARPTFLAHEDTGDLLSGSAGAISALLALHAQLGGDEYLETAVTCGHQWLARALSADTRDGVRWLPAARRAEVGMAHGLSGVAYAFARLAAVTGDRTFARASERAIEAERAALADTTTLARDESVAAWSHGATGVALARLAIGAADLRATAELESLLSLSRASLGRGGASLCSGDAGRVDLLAEAGRRLRRPEYTEEANRYSVLLAERLHATHSAAPPDTARLSEGLFQGDAGVAYTLLRLIDPHIPSLLLIAG